MGIVKTVLAGFLIGVETITHQTISATIIVTATTTTTITNTLLITIDVLIAIKYNIPN